MPPHDTMISVGIFGRRAAACHLAAGLLAAPALSRADGVMLIQAGALWMGRDDGSATHAPSPRLHPARVILRTAAAFWMGRDDGSPDEAPSHRVHVRDFWIDRHKVTNAEFAAF